MPAWWIGATFPLCGGIDLGPNDGRFWGDVGALGARGAIWGLLPAIVLWWPRVTLDGGAVLVWGQGAPGWWALLIAGPLMPAAYWAGRQSWCRWPGLGSRDWCQMGEAIYGALLGAGALVSVG